MADSITNLRKFIAPEIIFGSGARKMAGRYALNYGVKKALLVTDPGVVAAGWVDDVIHALIESGIEYVVFTKVSPNPRSEEVMEGAELFRLEGCNAIVAVGGGSPMDCAKGVGIVVSNNMNILAYEGIDKVAKPVPPMICIPTTAGTSADVSQFCIITNRSELIKIAIVSKAIVPDVSLIDADTTLSMDPYLTACTGVDALVHSVEAFVSTASGPLTDCYALEAIQLITKYLPMLYDDLSNPYLREQIMLASMKAGLAFSNAILGAVHAMAHSLGGFLDLPHGECNAMLLDHVINYNFSKSEDRFKIIAENFGMNIRGETPSTVKRMLINSVVELKNNVGITKGLSGVGVKSVDIPELSIKASKDACLVTNPRKASPGDLATIYEEAM